MPRLALSAPAVVYDPEDGQIALQKESAVGVTADGTVLVPDRGRVAVFRSGASRPTFIGRKGSGPGEYQSVTFFGWLGDTLWIGDASARRVTYLPAMGRGSPITQSSHGGSASYFLLAPRSIAVNGAALSEGIDVEGSSPARKPRVPVVRIDRTRGRVVDTLFWLHVARRSFTLKLGTSTMVGAQLLSDASLWNGSRNGAFTVEVTRGVVAGPLAPPGVSQITLRAGDGRVRYSRGLAPDGRVTGADVAAVVKAFLDPMNTLLRQRKRTPIDPAEFAKVMYVPSHRFAVLDVVVADDGSVLLRGNDWNRARVQYTWLHPDGTTRGTFEVPATQRVRALRGDRVWSTRETEDGDVQLIAQTVR